MSNPEFDNFPTSDDLAPAEIREETDRLLDEVLLTLKLERAVILVKLSDSWCVASSHEVPTENFWNTAPISLSVVQTAAKGETIQLMDAGNSDQFGSKDSVFLTGIRSVACCPYTNSAGEVRALLYADNRINKGAFSADDVATLGELAQELGRRLFE